MNTEALTTAFSSLPGDDREKKSSVDQALRECLQGQIIVQSDHSLSLISLSIDGVIKGLCSVTAPFLLMGDLLDCSSLEQCDHVFSFMEGNVNTWKSSAFYSAGKNYLLRMCNDLLRRLSKSQHTALRCRIQLFLAGVFHWSDKSGLNLQSEFNLENVAVFSETEPQNTPGQQNAEEKENGKEEGEMEDEDELAQCPEPTYHNLHRKIQTLQNYFRDPVQCYDEAGWLTFLKYSEETLAEFKSNKVDKAQASGKELTPGGEDAYFASFLTREMPMDFQFSGSKFRRRVLVQYLILFQYLKGQVKFKSINCVLNDDQSTWIKKTTKLVYELLRETPPEGDKFAAMVERILKKEERWSVWKNEGCPNFVKTRPTDTNPTWPLRKRATPKNFLAQGPRSNVWMGNAELRKLWDLSPDNLEACRSKNRNLVPSLQQFFEKAIEQTDPANKVEDEDKVVRNFNFGWRALRLLRHHTPHSFQPVVKVEDYLDSVAIRLAEERSVSLRDREEDREDDGGEDRKDRGGEDDRGKDAKENRGGEDEENRGEDGKDRGGDEGHRGEDGKDRGGDEGHRGDDGKDRREDGDNKEGRGAHTEEDRGGEENGGKDGEDRGEDAEDRGEGVEKDRKAEDRKGIAEDGEGRAEDVEEDRGVDEDRGEDIEEDKGGEEDGGKDGEDRGEDGEDRGEDEGHRGKEGKDRAEDVEEDRGEDGKDRAGDGDNKEGRGEDIEDNRGGEDGGKDGEDRGEDGDREDEEEDRGGDEGHRGKDEEDRGEDGEEDRGEDEGDRGKDDEDRGESIEEDRAEDGEEDRGGDRVVRGEDKGDSGGDEKDRGGDGKDRGGDEDGKDNKEIKTEDVYEADESSDGSATQRKQFTHEQKEEMGATLEESLGRNEDVDDHGDKESSDGECWIRLTNKQMEEVVAKLAEAVTVREVDGASGGEGDGHQGD